MPNRPGKRTIGFEVPSEYAYSGTQFREAVDTLFASLWKAIDKETKADISKKNKKELDVLNWGCESG